VPEDKRERVGFKLVPTGGQPSLTIDKRSIEILRDVQAAPAAAKAAR